MVIARERVPHGRGLVRRPSTQYPPSCGRVRKCRSCGPHRSFRQRRVLPIDSAKVLRPRLRSLGTIHVVSVSWTHTGTTADGSH